MVLEFHPVEALRRLCVALGIDPDKRPVTRIVVDVSATDVPRATVHEVIANEAAGRVDEVITELLAPMKEEGA